MIGFARLAQPLLGLAFLTASSQVLAAGFYNLGTFWQGPALKITTAAQSIYNGNCSGAVTIESDLGGKPKKVSGNTIVTLAAPSGTTFYSDGYCSNAITTATLTSAATTVTVYALSTNTTAQVLSFTSPGYHAAAQTLTLSANPYIWTGAAGDNVWKTPGNWSGGAIPGTGSVAVFDGTSCTSACSPHITANLSTGSIRMAAAYTGTITQNAGFTMAFQGWTQLGGIFVGSSSGDAIALSGYFYLAGSASFTSTSGTLSFSSNYWTVSGSPTFLANSGSVSTTASYVPLVFTMGSTSFYNLNFNGQDNNIESTGAINVADNLTVNTTTADQMYGGSLSVGGNVTITGQGITTYQNNTSYGCLTLNGVNQTITVTGATTANLPCLYVGSSGTVTISGNPILAGAFVVNSGTVSAASSNFTITSSYVSVPITPLTTAIQNLTLSASGNGGWTVTGTFNVTGSLTLLPGTQNPPISGGTINVSGNVANNGYGTWGTGTIALVGSAGQTLDVSGLTGTGAHPQFPGLKIAPTAGTVTLNGSFSVNSNFVVASGASVSPGTGTVTDWVYGASAGTFTPGSATYASIILESSSNVAINIGSSIRTSGNLQFGNAGFGGAPYRMPNPGTGYSLTVGGTMVIATSASVYLYGATDTYGTLSNSGALYP